MTQTADFNALSLNNRPLDLNFKPVQSYLVFLMLSLLVVIVGVISNVLTNFFLFISGILKDQTGSWNASFLFSGFAMLCGSFILLFDPLAVKYDQKSISN